MPTTPPLPRDIQLQDGETILRTGRDWSSAVQPLLLTNQRLICPIDPSGGGTAIIQLADVHSVKLRKAALGFASVVIEYGEQQRASFPAHFNPERVRADIASAVERVTPMPAAEAGNHGPTTDRYDRLRKIGELRASGVLTNEEFEAEKARILNEP